MLKLKNLRRNDNIISAEYDPENSGMMGSVSVNADNGRVVSATASEMDFDFPIYLNHAIDALREFADMETLPAEKMVMWY